MNDYSSSEQWPDDGAAWDGNPERSARGRFRLQPCLQPWLLPPSSREGFELPKVDRLLPIPDGSARECKGGLSTAYLDCVLPYGCATGWCHS